LVKSIVLLVATVEVVAAVVEAEVVAAVDVLETHNKDKDLKDEKI
jgi:hypothetical protein